MVIEAEQLEKENFKINNDTFKADFEWLEKLIDENMLFYRDSLCAGKQVKISNHINMYTPPYQIRCIHLDILCDRIISKDNFYGTLCMLQTKYKKNGWKISLKTSDPLDKIRYLSLKKIKSQSFWKSLFLRNRKKYSSILDEMEKKYSQG